MDLRLIQAFEEHDEDTVLLLLADNIHKTTPTGETPLHLACRYSDLNAVIALIDLGANIHAKDHYGFTPFSYAEILYDTRISEVLYSYNYESSFSTSPPMYASI